MSWTNLQVWAFVRQYITFFGGVLCGAAIVILWHIDADGLIKLVVALTGFLGAVVPIINSIKAANNASPAAQAEGTVQHIDQISENARNAISNAVAQNIDRVTNGARTQIINAVGTMPEVSKVIADPVTARITPSEKVVSQ